jgi:hypothetical protein
MIRNFPRQRPPKRIFSRKSRPQATRPAVEQNFSFSYSQKNPRLTIHGSTHPRANPTAFSQRVAPPFSPRRCPSRGEHRDRGATVPNMSRWKASAVAATRVLGWTSSRGRGVAEFSHRPRIFASDPPLADAHSRACTRNRQRRSRSRTRNQRRPSQVRPPHCSARDPDLAPMCLTPTSRCVGRPPH